MSEPVFELRRKADNYRGLKVYEVVVGDKVLGTVEGYHPTFERSIPGSRIVSKRWTSKKVYWTAHYQGAYNPYRLPYETQKRAVEAILRNAQNKGLIECVTS